MKRRVEDLLETYAGEWMSVSSLTVEYDERFDPVKRESVRRAVKRVVSLPTSSVRVMHRFVNDIPVIEARHLGYASVEDASVSG